MTFTNLKLQMRKQKHKHNLVLMSEKSHLKIFDKFRDLLFVGENES